MSRKLALVIGNTTYSDPRFGALSTPAADVNSLAQLLQNPAIGSFDQVEPLINQTQSLVSRTVEKFFSAKMREDLLLFYFSGHGMLDEDGHLYLAVNDTEWETPRSSALSAEFVSEAMDRSRSQRIVLILDCCHSGAFARGAKAAVGGNVGTKSAFEGTGYGRWVLTATDATQYAWEGDKLIGQGAAAGTSVFTRCLVNGLQTGDADLDHDGFISVRDISDYTFDQVARLKANQTPSLWTYKEQGNVILACNPKPVLPSELMDAVHSSFTSVRRGAVDELARLAANRHEGIALLAQDALRNMLNDDSRQVAQAAADALHISNAPVQVPPSPPAPVQPPVSTPVSPPTIGEQVAGTSPEPIPPEVPSRTKDKTTSDGKIKNVVTPSRKERLATIDLWRKEFLMTVQAWGIKSQRSLDESIVTTKTGYAGVTRHLQPLIAQLNTELRKPSVRAKAGASVLALAITIATIHYWPHRVEKEIAGPQEVVQKNAESSVKSLETATPSTSTEPLNTALESGKTTSSDVDGKTSVDVDKGPTSSESHPAETAQKAPHIAKPAPLLVSPAVARTYLESSPSPVYPPAARAARIQGTVTMAARISPEGKVTTLTATKGHPLLSQAAVQAVRNWQYRPYLVGGKPVAIRTQIFLIFALNDAPPQSTSPAQTTPPAQTLPPAQTTAPAQTTTSAQTAHPTLNGGRAQVPGHSEPIYLVGNGVSPPVKTYDPRPDYTEAARQARLQGSVILQIIVKADGKVDKDIKVLQGLGMGLDEQAVATMRKWRFNPALKDDRPVAVQIKVNMSFVLY